MYCVRAYKLWFQNAAKHQMGIRLNFGIFLHFATQQNDPCLSFSLLLLLFTESLPTFADLS